MPEKWLKEVDDIAEEAWREKTVQPARLEDAFKACELALEVAETLREYVDPRTPGQILKNVHVIYNPWSRQDLKPEVGIDVLGASVYNLIAFDDDQERIASICFQDYSPQEEAAGRRWLTVKGPLPGEGFWQRRYSFDAWSIGLTECLNQGGIWRETGRPLIEERDISFITGVLTRIQLRIAPRLKELKENRRPYDPAVGIT